MGYEKEQQIKQQDNWLRYASLSGKRCAFCNNVLTYEEYTDLSGKCLACANATDPSK
jgi:hypothetical protein